MNFSRKVSPPAGRTKSEGLFERFLTDNGLEFERIREDTSSRPDYLVRIAETNVIFEIKEISKDEIFDAPGVVHSNTVGSYVRESINSSRKQIQYGANQGIPSVLLIYNAFDPLQWFGTLDLDFETAMYGELTMFIDRRSGATSELFNGKNQSLQVKKNTSFSAVGRLMDMGGRITVTLFENFFSKVPLP
ncbi:MAG TPA: hypothetical protein VIY49_03655 [Bryobacteraceae bacterium]